MTGGIFSSVESRRSNTILKSPLNPYHSIWALRSSQSWDSVTKYQGQNTNGSEYRRTKYRRQNTTVKLPQYRIPQVIIPVSKYQGLQYHTGQNTVLVKIPYWTKYRTGQTTALDKIPHMIYIYMYELQFHKLQSQCQTRTTNQTWFWGLVMGELSWGVVF